MDATDRLRALLDERGVRWTAFSKATIDNQTFCRGRTYTEFQGGLMVTDLTPEQAVEATLGRGECHDVYPKATYCFTCSECGHIRRFVQGWNNVTDSSQDGFNYCPNCGRKVVE